MLADEFDIVLHFDDYPFGIQQEFLWPEQRLGNLDALCELRDIVCDANQDPDLVATFQQHVIAILQWLEDFVTKLGVCPRIDSTEVPNTSALSIVDIIRNISSQMGQMETILTQSDEICENLAKNKKALDEVMQQPLKEVEEEALLRSTEPDDGFKVGWRGGWWRHGRRQRADEVLARKLQRWMVAEDKDEAGDTQIELLYSLLANLKGRLAVLQRMQSLMVGLNLPGVDLMGLLHEKERLLEMLQSALENCIRRHENLEQELHGHNQKAQKCLKGMQGQQSEHELELKRLEDELSRLMNLPIDELVEDDPTVARLREELEELRRLLLEKEEELANERQAARRRIEEQCEQDTMRLQEALANLQDKHKATKAMQKRQQDEDAARQQAMMEQLEKGQNIIDTLRNSVEACCNTIEYVKQQQQFISDCVASIDEVQHLKCHSRKSELPTIRARMMEVAVELYELLIFLCREKQQRVTSIETTMESRTMLLEFCVDTQDPNAHKHEQIISELTVMREQLQQDVDHHQMMINQLSQQCRSIIAEDEPPDPYFEEALRVLRERVPPFFNLIEGRALTKAVVPQRQGPTPTVGSKYVATKRSLASPAKGNSPLAITAPLSPPADSKLFQSYSLDLPLDELLGYPEVAALASPQADSPEVQGRMKALAPSSFAADATSPSAAATPVSAGKMRRRRMNTQALSPAAPVHFIREEFYVTGMLP